MTNQQVNPFAAATKEKAKLRLALAGISGAGKTFTALALATAIAEAESTRVAVVDTENGSASKYAHLFGFDTLSMREPYGYEKFIEYVRAAEQHGYGVLVFDSLSAAWEGEGGLQTAHEAATRRLGDSFRGWAEITPLFKRLMRAILNSKAHIIATLQVTTEYQIEDKGNGRKNMRPIGTKPVMKAGFEYYFDIIGTLDNADLLVSKTRNPALTNRLIAKPGAPLATEILDWLNAGVEPREPEPEEEEPIQRLAPTPAPKFTKPATNGQAPMTEAAGVAPQQTGNFQERPATEPQIKAIYAIARGAQAMDDGTLENLCRQQFGCLPADLTRHQAAALTDRLKLGTSRAVKPEPTADEIARDRFKVVAADQNLTPKAICQVLNLPVLADGTAASAIEDAAKSLGWEALMKALAAGKPVEPQSTLIDAPERKAVNSRGA